ncbi:MAG: DegT/DnrJ/EryC1/StrS family aminotransferase, partial [Muribaculaceae bacterium]|nr:DegT/DnrJ/EryC1/StrS family aminotransferase [Muribaculaceae bacterium]
ILKHLYRTAGDMVWHQYVVMTPERARFRDYLMKNGVQTDVHYATPPHRQPCYAGTLGKLALPVTDLIAARVVSLPVTRCTSEEDASAIAKIINRYGND